MKLIIDEMWSPVVARELRERGHDVIAVRDDENLRSISDAGLLVFARSEQRVVVTENHVDFRRLVDVELLSGRSHAGIVYTSPRTLHRGDRRSVGRLVRALELLLGEDPEMTNREVWLAE